jgi:serine/threonine protein kinase
VVRDVKPENFLFLDDTPDAPLKMIDFGIAVSQSGGGLPVVHASLVLVLCSSSQHCCCCCCWLHRLQEYCGPDQLLEDRAGG